VTHFYYTAPQPITDPTKTYNVGTEYEVFNITVDVNPTTLNMQLVHSPGDETPYYLALTNHIGQDLRTTTESTYFYPITNTSGDPYFVALAAQSPAPVAFKEFNVAKQGAGNAL